MVEIISLKKNLAKINVINSKEDELQFLRHYESFKNRDISFVFKKDHALIIRKIILTRL